MILLSTAPELVGGVVVFIIIMTAIVLAGAAISHLREKAKEKGINLNSIKGKIKDSTISKSKLLDQLRALTDLRDRRAISDEEYEELKKGIMEKLKNK